MRFYQLAGTGLLLFIFNLFSVAGQDVLMDSDTTSARWYSQRGNHLLERSEADSAFIYCNWAKDIFLENEMWNPYIEMLNNIGVCWVYKAANDLDKPLNALNFALSEGEKYLTPNDSVIGDILSNIGYVWMAKGEYGIANEYNVRALEIFKSTKGERDKNVAISMNNIGNIYETIGDFELSMEYLGQALAIHLENQDSIHIATVYLNIGRTWDLRGDWDRAMTTYQAGLPFLSKDSAANRRELATYYDNIASLYAQKGDYEHAFQYSREALKLRRTIFGEPSTEVAASYSNMSVNYIYMGKLDQALTYAFRALEMDEEILNDNHPVLSIDIHNIAHIYHKQYDHQKAIEYEKKAIWILESNPDYKGRNLGDRYESLGDYYASILDYQTAVKHLQKSIMLFESIIGKGCFEVANVQHKMGLVYARMGEFSTAFDILDQSLGFFFSGSDPETILNSLKNSEPKHPKRAVHALWAYGKIYQWYFEQITHEKDDAIRALKYYQAAEQLVGFVRVNYLAEQSQLRLMEESRKIYEDGINTAMQLYKQTTDPVYFTAAFEFAEKSKATLLLATLRQPLINIYSGIPDSIASREVNLKRAIRFYKDEIIREQSNLEGKNDEKKIRLWEGKLFDYRRQFEELASLLKVKYPRYYQATYDEKVPDITTIRKSLFDSSSALVEYFLGEHNLYVFVITQNGLEAHVLDDKVSLTEWILEFREGIYGYYLCEDPENGYLEMATQYADFAHKLYNFLIEPLGDLPPNLVIVPDGALGYIPFDALLSGKPARISELANYPYLIRSHRISYAYSATILLDMQSRIPNNRSKHRVLAFAPNFPLAGPVEELPGMSNVSSCVDNSRGSLSPLRYNVKEVMAIADMFHVDAFLGKEALVKNFIDQAPHYRVIHLATHAVAYDSMPIYTHFAFTYPEDTLQSQYAFISDLYNLELNADMVVASACETGIGKLYKGEGMMSLARGFSYAGAKSIITSMWSVNDEHSSHLMVSFYEYLKKGYSKSEALYRAKIDMMAEKPAPFFWASFIPIGDMAPVELSENGYASWAILLVICMLGITLFVGWRYYG